MLWSQWSDGYGVCGSHWFCSGFSVTLLWLFLLWPLDRSRSTRGLKTSPTIEAPLDRAVLSCTPRHQSYVLRSYNLRTCPFKALNFKDARRCVRLRADRLPLMNSYLQRSPPDTTHRRVAFQQDSPRSLPGSDPICVCQSCLEINSRAAFHQHPVGCSPRVCQTKQHVCSHQFQVYPTKLDNAAQRIKYRLAIFFFAVTEILHILSVTTVYSHNLDLEKLQITAGLIIENTTYDNNERVVKYS